MTDETEEQELKQKFWLDIRVTMDITKLKEFFAFILECFQDQTG